MLRFAAAVACVFVTMSAVYGGNAHYPDNQPPLKETPFAALPLGSVRANGWLLKQLEMQRAGLTGHAEEALIELNETSAWRGGDKDNWERSPYYVKGLIPLAYTLDDAALKQRAQKWVEWCLASQRADGFYGPKQNDDWWPRMVSNYFLRDYHEATGDPRVLPFLTRYYRYMLEKLPKRPLRDWGKSRAGDDMDTVVWLYNRTHEKFLLELVDLLRSQAYDWPTIMHDNTFQGFGTDFQPKHNVNVPQAMKMPAVSWQRTGDAKERTAIDAGDAHLMREHGLSVGLQSGTEFLAGRSPGQGIEFCSIVEQMLSDETIVRIFGDGKYADRLEQMAYNALPAAWNRDLTALRYYTLPNHVIAKRGGQGFGQNYDNGIVYGPRSGYPCCCFNVHQGWPKFVQNSWMATNDNGLAVIAYAPNTVTGRVGGGATATVMQETRYPFDDEIRFKITMSAPTSFPLSLRTPGWCERPSLTVNGQPVDAAKRGAFRKITREWKTGDEVVVKLPMSVRVRRGVHDSVSVHRGPLMYALRIDHEKRVVGQTAPGFDEFEETPKGAWNYALSIGATNPSESFELLVDAKPAADANPFAAETTPVKLTANARKLPEWGLAWNGVVAFDPPASPVRSNEPDERVTLVPFGAQDLRLTDFPVLGEPAAAASEPLTFSFDENDTAGWSWIGGGWWAHEGKLRTSPTGGAPGFKALLEKVAYENLRLEADITPPPAGDAGLIFRVSKPSIGADAYEGYYAGISASGKQVIVGRADGRSWTPLKVASRAIP
ncbi:MAG: hypothetical protein QOF78_2945, partial [Phycisphaerales bacterium]|nr:hypothetical protein [Phycisphaerales bacterium]